MDTLTQNGAEAAVPDTDALLAEVLGESVQTENQSSSNEPKDQKTDFEVDFTWKGKEQRMPWSKAKAFVQKGYDYEQNIAALKREREEFLRERNQYGVDPDRLKELKQIDDYARQNPQFLSMVKHYWTQAQQGQLQPGQAAVPGATQAPAFDPIQSTLQSLTQKIEALEQEKNQTQIERAGSELDSHLTQLKENFKFLDWEKTDDFGFNREHQVLRYIQNYGVDANKAFWALYGEEVAKAREDQARQKTLSDVQEKHKRGVFIGKALSKGTSATPSKDLSNKSYDDITRNVMKELNINY